MKRLPAEDEETNVFVSLELRDVHSGSSFLCIAHFGVLEKCFCLDCIPKSGLIPCMGGCPWTFSVVYKPQFATGAPFFQCCALPLGLMIGKTWRNIFFTDGQERS